MSRALYIRREGGSSRPDPGALAGGFTLLELVIALFVLSVALVAVVDTVSVHLDSAAHVRDRTLAHWVAMNKVAEYQLMDDWPPTGTTNGDVEMGGRDWYWEVTVNNAPFDKNVRRLDVDVAESSASEHPLAHIVAYAERSF